MTNETRPRMMAFNTVLPQLKQENANLRDLLNASMAENVALLKQVSEQQEALDGTQALWMASMVQCNTLEFELDGANKRIDELTAALADMNERQRLEWSRAENAEAKADKLTTALRQLIAQIDTSVSTICDSLRQDGDVYAVNVNTLTALAHMRDDAQKVLEDAPGDVAVYSIYTDPLIVGVAADLDCTVDELMEYAMDSVGAPTEIKTIEGCHSAGTHNCYGDLWTCKGCGNRFCDAEGSDDGFIDFCDDCWAKAQGEAE